MTTPVKSKPEPLSMMQGRVPYSVAPLITSPEQSSKLLVFQILEHLNIHGRDGKMFPVGMNAIVMRWLATLPQKERVRLRTEIADFFTQHTPLGTHSLD